MNYDRIYQYRFSHVPAEEKAVAWQEIGRFLSRRLGGPQTVLDPAAGRCEFINSIEARECWAGDLNGQFLAEHAQDGVRQLIGDVLEVEYPGDYFEGILVSNFLEHLPSQEAVAEFLGRMYAACAPGGRIAIMGPNFKYAFREYFDFADHTVVLSETGVAEHLYGAGFTVEAVYGRFLPLSFRSGPKPNRFLVRSYLSMPFAWRFFGKQFLVIGKKEPQ
jgi:hypothetical protein